MPIMIAKDFYHDSSEMLRSLLMAKRAGITLTIWKACRKSTLIGALVSVQEPGAK